MISRFSGVLTGEGGGNFTVQSVQDNGLMKRAKGNIHSSNVCIVYMECCQLKNSACMHQPRQLRTAFTNTFMHVVWRYLLDCTFLDYTKVLPTHNCNSQCLSVPCSGHTP